MKILKRPLHALNRVLHDLPSLFKTWIKMLHEQVLAAAETLKIWSSKKRRLRTVSSGKPSIMLLVDVPGWAWDYKAKQITRYLSDEFNFSVLYWSDFKYRWFSAYVNRQRFDLHFTFECNFVPHLKGTDYRRLITGVTAHTYVNFENYQNLLKTAYAVHANSRILFDEIKKINPNCYYVPNGVDESHFQFKERDLRQPFTAAYVEKNTKRKGFENYVVPACQKAGVPLKSLTAKYHHPDRLPREEMPEFYRDIDVVLIASDMDGTPNQLLEAAAVGRTFIGNKIGNVPEFANGRNGFIVERNVEDYAEKLVWLKNHRETCREMGREARKSIEHHWTWAAQAENYRHLFRKVLGRA